MKYTKETALLITLLFTQILIFGIISNFIVMINNNGDMPVKADFDYSDNAHFTYQDNKDVKYWYLSDIIEFKNSIWSIGDILIYIGLVGWLLFYSSYLFLKFNIPQKMRLLGGGKRRRKS